MAIQQTPRFGIDRPDGPADPFDLAQLLDFIDAIEASGAKAGHGTIAARPGATAAWAKGFWVISDAAGGGILAALYFCTGAAWLHLNPQQVLDFGEVGDITRSHPGDAAAAGATGEVADAGHRHAREPRYRRLFMGV